jgi:hypothetical protein
LDQGRLQVPILVVGEVLLDETRKKLGFDEAEHGPLVSGSAV